MAAVLDLSTPFAVEARALRLRLAALAAGGCVVALMSLGLMAVRSPALGLVLAAAIPAGLVLARWPAVGFYTVYGAAILIDHYKVIKFELATALSLPSGRLPFWQTFGGVTAADAVCVVAVVAVALRHLHARRAPLRAGPLLVPCLAFMAMVVYGVWRGMTYHDNETGLPFDAGAALQEIRAFVYLPLLYLMAHTFVRTRRDVRVMMWITVITLGLKSLQALWITARLGPTVLSLNEIATHEDSIFVCLLPLMALAYRVYGGPPRMQRVIVLLLPLAALTLVANHRRVSFIGLGFALALLVLLLAADGRLRRGMVIGGGVAALVLGLYVSAFWNAGKEAGPIALPVYSARSVTDPKTERDLNSNLFRDMENINIARTIDRAPLLGTGFGQRYVNWIEEPTLDGSGFTYWRYITHNAIYWVWMKLGAIGFIAFWILIANTLALAAATFRRLPPGELRAAAMVAMGLVAMQMLYAYADLGLTSARNVVLLGSWMGLIASLHRMAPAATDGVNPAGR